MERRQNTISLIRAWAGAAFFGILAVGILAWARRQGYFSDTVSLLFLLLGIVTAVAMGVSYLGTNAQLKSRLQSRSAQAVLDLNRSSFGKANMPDKDAYLAFSNALALTLYEQFETAGLEMEKVAWEAKSQLAQAQVPLFQALRAYLEGHDFERGLILAREARRMADTPKVFPGAAVAMNLYDAMIEIGEVLAGPPDPRVVSSLERRFERSLLLLKLIIAWALEEIYLRSGRAESAQTTRAFVARIAPHCGGLSRLREKL